MTLGEQPQEANILASPPTADASRRSLVRNVHGPRGVANRDSELVETIAAVLVTLNTLGESVRSPRDTATASAAWVRGRTLKLFSAMSAGTLACSLPSLASLRLRLGAEKTAEQTVEAAQAAAVVAVLTTAYAPAEAAAEAAAEMVKALSRCREPEQCRAGWC